MKAISCNQVEPLLCDYLDGLLSAAEEAVLEEHVTGCQTCSLLVADMRLAMRYAQEAGAVDVPVELISRILDQTTGQTPAGVPEWRHRLTGWWDRTVSPVVRSVLEPRFALGMAMTVISFSMVLSLTGFDVRRLEWSDLQPSHLTQNVRRGVVLAGAHATKYYENLRVVYEIQSQLQEWRDASADSGANPAADSSSDSRTGTSGSATPSPAKQKNDHRGNGSGGDSKSGGSGSDSNKDNGSSKSKDNSNTAKPNNPPRELNRPWGIPVRMVACAL